MLITNKFEFKFKLVKSEFKNKSNISKPKQDKS